MADPSVEAKADAWRCHGGDTETEDRRDEAHEKRTPLEKGSKNRVEQFGPQKVVGGKSHCQDGCELSEG
jgi:hypothetical protein